MKILLTFTIVLIASFSLKADELDNISLILPTPYARPSSASQTIKSGLKILIGNIINVDIKKEVEKKIAPFNKDLVAYFPASGELSNFIDKTVTAAINVTVKNDLSERGLIAFYQQLGTKLIGGIADKILSTEGVTDPARRTLWVNKMLAPFNACIRTSKNSQYDASHCMDALTSSLVPSAGVGLVYELSRSNLNSSVPEKDRPAFDAQQVLLYKQCMSKTNSEAKDVKDCALSAMRTGVLKVTDTKLTATIKGAASSADSAKNIKATVWKDFQPCINASAKVEQFMGCIDNLVEDTGVQLVQNQILTNPSVKANLSNSEITKLVTDEVSSFKKCIANQKAYNKRKDGMLDTDECANTVTNEVTYNVVIKSLADSAKDSFKTDPKMASDTAKDGVKLLNQCWSNEQDATQKESCLRKTVISFANKIASIKLDKSIPNQLAIKKDLTRDSIKDFTTCLEKNLPKNISSADNLSTQTAICTNQLTRNVAYNVAKESVRQKALESKLSQSDTEKLIKLYVDQKFMTCLGTEPTDDKIDNCSGELTTSIATNLATIQIRSNAAGKVTPEETEVMVNKLVNQNFKSCLGSKPSDATLDNCVATLTKDATKSIVLAYEKKQLKEQLNADFSPAQLKEIDDKFVACVDKTPADKDASKKLDECTKQFSLGFAKVLGELKINSLMRSVLGSEDYNKQKKDIDKLLGKYNTCIDNLQKVDMQDGLLDKLTVCTDGLQQDATKFITENVNIWMSTDTKDALALLIKGEFANFIPCLGGLLPASPYNPKMEENVESILKPLMLIISDYIEYDPENAKKTLDEIIRKLSGDLRDVATNSKSQDELIDMLYQNGALDQFLKSMVQSQVKTALAKIPESELPKNIRAMLLDKNNFDKIFSTPEGKAIKDAVMEKILKPALKGQKDMKSPEMTAAMDSVKDKVVQLLVRSPSFGDQIIKGSIQSQINNMGGATRIFAKIFYGKNALDWEKVRTTPDGKLAEDYIRDHILLPKFQGKEISKEEEQNISAEAEKLVTKAVKKYRD